MKIAILGRGLEGRSAENYFKHVYPDAEITFFDHITASAVDGYDLNSFDLVFRSPSVSPHWLESKSAWTTGTRIFFDQCPASIIGVTGTKGKGTTSTLTTKILEAIGHKVWLVGNIGTPSLDVLQKIKPTDVVVYEMSSFQLWDLEKSPHIAIVLRITPDHLDRHRDFSDYVSAKSHIVKYQNDTDFCIYDSRDPEAANIATSSLATKFSYPCLVPGLDDLLDHLQLIGEHNREDATLALLAASCYENTSPANFIKFHQQELEKCFSDFPGLPHRLEFIRELNGVSYYDDNYSSNFSALDVAIAAFPHQPTILIAGGKDRGLDLSDTKKRLFSAPNLKKVILIGETKYTLSENADPAKFELAETLPEAVALARQAAENYPNAVVVMSPGAASFDMFKNFQDRGEQFQKLIKDL